MLNKNIGTFLARVTLTPEKVITFIPPSSNAILPRTLYAPLLVLIFILSIYYYYYYDYNYDYDYYYLPSYWSLLSHFQNAAHFSLLFQKDME
tara:strand:- start:401 stop:676 length:276 start_codon:yes stop_codon:yes gene_type:complete